MEELIHAGCGGTIYEGMYTSYPGIPFKKCSKCGMEQRGEQQKIIRREIIL